ncbi:MAG: hypothetical protein P8L79_03615 [Rhodospirillaceae bacterium]|jgi:hypothetical protein|nr:hypothetical protein [Rhodospirillaceae bacterium]
MPSRSFVKLIGLILLLSLGPLSIYFLYKQTGGLESRRELAFHRHIRFSFMAGTDEVDIKTLTDWPWETVCAFDAGLSQSQVDTLVGFSFGNFSQLTWRDLDDHWTLLFIDSERETNWGDHRPTIPIRIPKDTIASYDFSEDNNGRCVARPDATLKVYRHDVPQGLSPVIVELTKSTAGT